MTISERALFEPGEFDAFPRCFLRPVNVMQTPVEFFDFCLQLHQDLRVVYGSDPQDWIDGALERIPRERRLVLGGYIKHLLNGPYTGEELQAIWRSTDADWRCDDEQSLRYFLKMVCDTIDRDAATT